MKDDFYPKIKIYKIGDTDSMTINGKQIQSVLDYDFNIKPHSRISEVTIKLDAIVEVIDYPKDFVKKDFVKKR